MKVIAYTDGASRGNPGLAAIGIAIYDAQGEMIKTHSQFLGEATNNVAEYQALIKALEIAQELGATEIDICADSELVVKQIKGEYRVKNEGLKPLYNKARGLISAFEGFQISHVRREFNKMADKLANLALDNHQV